MMYVLRTTNKHAQLGYGYLIDTNNQINPHTSFPMPTSLHSHKILKGRCKYMLVGQLSMHHNISSFMSDITQIGMWVLFGWF